MLNIGQRAWIVPDRWRVTFEQSLAKIRNFPFLPLLALWNRAHGFKGRVSLADLHIGLVIKRYGGSLRVLWVSFLSQSDHNFICRWKVPFHKHKRDLLRYFGRLATCKLTDLWFQYNVENTRHSRSHDILHASVGRVKTRLIKLDWLYLDRLVKISFLLHEF